MRKRILLSWSSGKDSAWALHVLWERGEYEVAGLLTTINSDADRVAMHGVRRELLEAQARAVGLPLWALPLPWPCSNDDYERVMAGACSRAISEEIHGIAFGDLFLEDVRAYRIARLAGTGLEPLFPIWGIPTGELAREMLRGGLRARITCVDTQVLPADFAGREFDERLLEDFERIGQSDDRVIGKSVTPTSADCPITGLPDCQTGSTAIDPCGERGEFHTFCYSGPMFAMSIGITTGEIVVRGRFAFADLLPAANATQSIQPRQRAVSS